MPVHLQLTLLYCFLPEKVDYRFHCYGPGSTTKKYKPRYLQKIQCQFPEAGYSPAESRREKCSFLRFASPGVGSLNRSEEHTSELQSRGHLVCRLLLEKKKHKYGICSERV